MRILLPLLACAIAAPAAAHDAHAGDAEAPYPALEVLNAFREGCGSIDNQAAASASLDAAGWQRIDAFMPVQLAMFVTFARETGGEAVEAQGGTMSEMEVFEKTIAGERVFIILSEVKVSDIRVSGCRLFDLGETRQVLPETVTQWLDREPAKVIDQEQINVADWEPGISEGHDSFQLFFVPPGSPVKEAFKFDGVAFKSDTVGVEK